MKSLKGVKDYLPKEQVLREKIIDLLKKTFVKYAFEPMETSILELYEIASAKYGMGEEIMKEVYRLKDQGNRELVLRYELTFKLAKAIAQNKDILLPFKRYEIGKVFRDGPVKTGRLREFTQCDIDTIGVKSRCADAEFMAIIFDFFSNLGIDVFVKVNSRMLLFGIFKEAGVEDEKFISVALSLDKLDKLGKEKVKKELSQKIEKEEIEKIFSILENSEKISSNMEKIEFFKKELNNEVAKKGIEELEEFFYFVNCFQGSDNWRIKFSPFLARGLGYYTGLIWEVYTKNFSSSLAGGGRWDNLIQKYIGSSVEYPATGMSFGVDAIASVIQKSKEKSEESEKKVYIIPVEKSNLSNAIQVSKILRGKNIVCDIAFEKKLKKALEYANKKNFDFCIIIGKEEEEKGVVKVKDMRNGEEKILTPKELSTAFVKS
ncbi:MAG: histidine--tRNA ligase [Candidatus Micrarchaeia archaeon]|jgi:histidyl-tRNA synthetase